jgi:hypothetical protein
MSTSKVFSSDYFFSCNLNGVHFYYLIPNHFQVGMKKEWIMSEEARLEKKQRIQDNRERRMAERSQVEGGEGMMVVEDNLQSTSNPMELLANAVDNSAAMLANQVANNMQQNVPSMGNVG